MTPPSAPTAAASVGVARPNTIEPSTARIRIASGKNDASSILKISSRTKFQIAVEDGEQRDADAEHDPEPRRCRKPLPRRRAAAARPRLCRGGAASRASAAAGAAGSAGAALSFGVSDGGSCRPPASLSASGVSRAVSAGSSLRGGASERPPRPGPAVSTDGVGRGARMPGRRPAWPRRTIAGISVTSNCPSAVALGHAGARAARASRAEQPGQRVAAARGELPAQTPASATARSLVGQRRHQVGPDLREHDDVADVQAGQHEAGEEGARVELHHRHAGDRAVDDQQHRRRNQDAEAAAGGDHARRDLDVVAGLAASPETRAAPSASRPRRRCRWPWRRSRR